MEEVMQCPHRKHTPNFTTRAPNGILSLSNVFLGYHTYWVSILRPFVLTVRATSLVKMQNVLGLQGMNIMWCMSNKVKGEVCFFCTFSLVIRIFTIIYNVLQHRYDKLFSLNSWSSLLTLAENNRDSEAFQVPQQFIEKGCFKRRDNRQIFSGVFSCYNTKTGS